MSTLSEPTLFVWTRETYERAGEVGIFGDMRVELVEGQVVQMSPMGSRHATAIDDVADALKAALGPAYYVRCQLPLPLGQRSEPEPDVAVVRGTRDDYRDHHPRTAELIVEISDKTLAFDRGKKARIYALAMIPEYWIVNLNAEQIEIFRQPSAEGKYSEKFIVTRGEVLSPLAAPGTVLRVENLLP